MIIKEELNNYMRSNAGRQSRDLANSINPMGSNIGIPGYLPPVEPQKLKIFSVRPKKMTTDLGSQGKYIIPACIPGKRAKFNAEKKAWTLVDCDPKESYSLPLCIPSYKLFATYNLAQNKQEVKSEDVVSGEEFARSIVNPPVTGGNNNKLELGVFVTYNNEPTPEEVAAALKSLEATYQRLVLEAKNLSITNNRDEITSSMREAAAYLGVRADWNLVQNETTVCESCGDPIVPTVKVHTCGYVRDWQFAVEEGIKTLEQVPTSKRGDWWQELATTP
jgi:hypothetical protein